MTAFSTYRAFQNFRAQVMRNSRYVLDESSQSFLKAVLETSADRIREVPAGRVFWRAQLGHGWRAIEQDGDGDDFEIPAAYSRDRMTPLRHAAGEGRANPKGIPCLYLATDDKTAMAEVRPSVGSYISVGQFKTMRPLRLIDCSIGHRSGFTIFLEEPSESEVQQAVWNDIDRAFSEPITLGDTTADYAPTQILSELFKREGFDGIAFASHLGKGFNLALFDLDAAEIINCCLYRVKAVSYEFSQEDNPCFVSKHYKTPPIDDENDSKHQHGQ